MSSACGLTDRGDGVVAFKRQREYAEHMLSSHNIKSASSSYSSLSSHIQASFSVQGSAGATVDSPGYLDLQFNSSNPYSIESEDVIPMNSRHETNRNRHATSETARTDEILVAEDFPPVQEQFPSLWSSYETGDDGSNAGTTQPNSHPLSLASKISERKRAAAAKRVEEERVKELQKAFDSRRDVRNNAFADALGLGNKGLVQHVRGTAAVETDLSYDIYYSLSYVPLFSELMRSENPHGLMYVRGHESPSFETQMAHMMQILRRPLYSTDLIGWAKNNRVDLLKVEKSIQALLKDERASSVQLKPMKKWSLQCIHELAKYYNLNSQEYLRDTTPNRIIREGQVPPPSHYISLVKTIDSNAPSILLSAAAAFSSSTPKSQFPAKEGAASSQVELQELLLARENMGERGILRSALYFMINTKQVNVGTTVGDFLLQIKDLVSVNRYSRPKPKFVVNEEDRIVEFECIGNGLLKVSLNSFAAAKRLLDIVMDENPSHGMTEWHRPSSSSSSSGSRDFGILIPEKFYVSALFSEEDIKHATFMDEKVEEEFLLQHQDKTEEIVVENNNGASQNGSHGDDISDDWNSLTPSQIEKMSQSLAEKQATLDSTDSSNWRNAAASLPSTSTSTPVTSSAVLSSSRPDVRGRSVMTASVFMRQNLPAPVENGATSEVPKKSAGTAKSKFSLHTPSEHALLRTQDTNQLGPYDGMDALEASEYRAAVEESLKDQHLSMSKGTDDLSLSAYKSSVDDSMQKSALDDDIFGNRSKRAGVYQAPRGGKLDTPYMHSTPAGRQCDNWSEFTKHRGRGHIQEFVENNEEEDARRVPIVVPQQMKQSVTYPIRYTYDRRNHRQQVQNSFSVLQNGEIDTYYQSDDEDDNNVTGDVNSDVTGDATGDVSDLTSNVTGDVTGDVTDDVSGDVTRDINSIYRANDENEVLDNIIPSSFSESRLAEDDDEEYVILDSSDGNSEAK